MSRDVPGDDGFAVPPGQSRQPGQEGKAQPVSGAPGPLPVIQAWATTVEPALGAAEQYLARTVKAVRPGLSVRTLLRVATGQRRQLAVLARACRDLELSLRQQPSQVRAVDLADRPPAATGGAAGRR